MLPTFNPERTTSQCNDKEKLSKSDRNEGNHFQNLVLINSLEVRMKLRPYLLRSYPLQVLLWKTEVALRRFCKIWRDKGKKPQIFEGVSWVSIAQMWYERILWCGFHFFPGYVKQYRFACPLLSLSLNVLSFLVHSMPKKCISCQAFSH